MYISFVLGNSNIIFQFSLSLFNDILRPFNITYRCWSVSMLPGTEREDVERGGKSKNLFNLLFCPIFINIDHFIVIMPPSALDMLTRLNINYPMLFKLSNRRTNRHTHCGVLEFIADEDKIYIPYWVFIIADAIILTNIICINFCFV